MRPTWSGPLLKQNDTREPISTDGQRNSTVETREAYQWVPLPAQTLILAIAYHNDND